MTVTERIDSLIQERGLSRRQLALASGIPPSSLQSAMARGKNMTLEMLLAIAAALGVDVNWLMNGQTLEQRDQAMKDYVERRFTEAELDKRLHESYGAMTVEGKGKVVSYAEDILPRYRAVDTLQSPPAPQEGKDTTQPPGAPETPQEGE